MFVANRSLSQHCLTMDNTQIHEGSFILPGRSGQMHNLTFLRASDNELWVILGIDRSCDWDIYKDSDTNVTFELLSSTERAILQDFKFDSISALADISLQLKASDNSTNPSQLLVYGLESKKTYNVSLNGGYDHTELVYIIPRMQLICKSSSNMNSCGQDGKPQLNEFSETLVILEIHLKPGSSSDVSENIATLMGYTYQVWLKLRPCNASGWQVQFIFIMSYNSHVSKLVIIMEDL